MHRSRLDLPHRAGHRRRHGAGFTVVELMIAVLVVGVLTAVALPSFMDSLRKGRRSEAISALAALQQAQERWRSSNANYTTDLGNSGLRQSSTITGGGYLTPKGYYLIRVENANATSYVATAAARDGTSQAADGHCTLLVVAVQTDGSVVHAAGSATPPLTDAYGCWAK